MKKKGWKPVNRIERKYSTLLEKLLSPVRKEILKNAGDIDKIKSILQKTANSKTFKRKADEIAKTIATMMWADNANNWREAAKKGSRGREIHELLIKELDTETIMKRKFDELLGYNATLIKTLPLDISKQVIEHIEKKTLQGQRAEFISDEVKSYFPKYTKARAELIARTETSKISSALTQARSESIGVKCYIWRTSTDQRVRSSHKHMEDVIVFYNNPPIPEQLDHTHKGKLPAAYNAGNIYNCRCYQEPVIDFNDTNWPHKVYNYSTNKIEMMTLVKFKEFGGKQFE